MRSRGRWSYSGFFTLGLLLLVLSGCATSAGPGGSGSPTANGPTPAGPTPTSDEVTPTPTPAPCATTASATAEGWVTTTAHPQVIGSINGDSEHTLSNFVYPLGLPNEGSFSNDFLAALAWSPDAQHLAVAVGVFVGPGETLFPYVVDTTSHAVTRVKLPGDGSISEKGSANRVFAWADTHTLLVFGGFGGGTGGSGGTVSYSYDVGSKSLTPLPGVTAAFEGVARCSTLFYLEVTALTKIGGGTAYKGSARLHRYDLTTHSEIGSPITLGDTSTFPGAEGTVGLVGWDASPDGSRIVYQQTHVSLNGVQIVTSSKFFAANANGSSASGILSGATSNTPAFLAISPDGQLVAVTNAQPTPTVFSGSMNGGSAHYYKPDAYGPPQWLGNNAQFEAELSPGSGEGIELWAVNTGGGKAAGSVAHASGAVPATLE